MDIETQEELPLTPSIWERMRRFLTESPVLDDPYANQVLAVKMDPEEAFWTIAILLMITLRGDVFKMMPDATIEFRSDVELVHTPRRRYRRWR